MISKLKENLNFSASPLFSRNQFEKRSWSYLLSSKIAFICELFCNLPFLSVNNSDCRECSLVLDDRASSVDAIFHFGCTLSLYQGQSGVLYCGLEIAYFTNPQYIFLFSEMLLYCIELRPKSIQAKFPNSNFNLLLTFMRVSGFRVFGLGQNTAPN